MVSRPSFRILPFLVALAACFSLPSTALAANHAPVCTPFLQSVAPFPSDRTVSIFNPAVTFCTDPDGDQLSYTVSGGTKGTLDLGQIQFGTFHYAPSFGSTGDDVLTLVAHDSSGGNSVPVSITMRITTANQAPVCLDDPQVYPVAKNHSKQLVGHCYDPDALDNDGAHVPLYNPLPPDHGVASPAPFGFNYSPVHDYLGQDIIHYTMTDAEGATSAGAGSTIVNVTAAGIPVCQPGATISQRMDKTIVGQLVCTDDIGTPASGLAWSVVTPPQHADVFHINNDGTFTFTPTAGFQGTDTFSYTATNFAGASDPPTAQSVQFSAGFNSAPSCTNINDTPIFDHQNRPLTLQYHCFDSQADPITLAVTTQGLHGTLSAPVQSPTDPTLYTATYTPTNGYSGADSVSVTPHDDQATNNTGSPVNADLTVITDAAEQAPACVPGTITVHNDNTAGAIFSPACSDAEHDVVISSLTTNPLHTGPPASGTITGPDANGVFSYVPNPAYVGSDTFVVHATDTIKTTDIAVTVTVLPPNHAPVCPDLSLLADHTAPTIFPLLAQCTDQDTGDTLTAVLDTATTQGTLSAVSPTGRVTYKPTVGFAGGIDSFSYHVFDTSGAVSGTQTATVHVDRVPTCTSPVPSPAAVAHNKTLNITPCVDADGDAMTYASDSDPSHGVLSSSNGHLIYTPTIGYSGADSFQVHADDGRGGLSDPLDVAVTVAADGAPSCTPRSYTLAFGASQVATLTCTDPDGDVVTPSVVKAPIHGFVGAVKNGTVTYTPNAGYSGTDSFTFRGTDNDPSHAASPSVTVSLTVGAGPAGPPTTPTPPPATTTTTPKTTPIDPGQGHHITTLLEIASKILGHPAAQVDVGFGKSVPAFVVKGVGSTLKVSGKSSTFLVYFCNCSMTVNQVLTGGGSLHTAAAKRGTTVKSTLTIPSKLETVKGGIIKLKLTSAQSKAISKGATITLKVTFATPGPKPKSKKQKQKMLKSTRTWHVKASKVTKSKKR